MVVSFFLLVLLFIHFLNLKTFYLKISNDPLMKSFLHHTFVYLLRWCLQSTTLLITAESGIQRQSKQVTISSNFASTLKRTPLV